MHQQETSMNVFQANLDSTRVESQRSHKGTLDAIASVQISSQANTAVLNDVRQLTTSLATKLSQTSSSSHQYYQQVTQSIMDNTAQLLKLQRDIARVPAIQPESCINLLDALDRPHKLPYNLFQDFEVS